MKLSTSTLILILVFNLSSIGQPFTHSGVVYGSNGQGLKDIPVLLYGKRIASYEVTFPNYPVSVSYSTGTVIPSSDDATHGPFNIGFSFIYFGVSYTQFYVGSNGWIGFSSGQTTGYTAAFIPNSSSPRNAILADWEDLLPGASNIYYSTSGTAPNRKLTISFNSVPHYGCRTNLHTFQFILYETTNIIDINYASKPLCNGSNATAGLISSVFSTVVPVGGKNASLWGATNYSVRFSPSTPESQFTLKGTFLTNSSGQYNMAPDLDDASHDFQIRLENLIIDTPKISDARYPIQILLGGISINSKTYYLMDINRDGIFSISDSYCIFSKISGRFSIWPNSYPSYRIFTQSEWSTINSNTTDLRTIIPGVQSFIISSPLRGGTSNFYLLKTGIND